MMRTLTIQEYYEIVQAQGLLTKSFSSDALVHDYSFPSTLSNDNDEVELLICTDDEDRFDDILNPAGCVTDNFSLNPLFLFEHGKQHPLLDSILGSIKGITITRSGIIAQAEYVLQDLNPLPKKVKEMELKGLLPGNSIGWIPLDGITIDDQGRRHVDKWELLEVSKVVIPVNGKATNKLLGREKI